MLSFDSESLSPNLLSKNIKIKYRTIIFLLFCMGVKHGH